MNTRSPTRRRAPLERTRARGLRAAGVVMVACACAAEPEHTGRTVEDGPSDTAAVVVPAPAAHRAWIDSLRAVERPRLQDAGDIAERTSWDRLVITTRGGARHVFTDALSDGELVRLHVYGGWFAPLAQHLVEVIYVPEGGQFLLVDGRGGDTLVVDGPPVTSPDGTRFVTTSLDLVAGHRPNRIRIYRLVADQPVLEWETAPRDWGAAAPLWLDSGAIRLDRTVVDWTTSPLSLRTAPMHIQRDGDAWRIVP